MNTITCITPKTKNKRIALIALIMPPLLLLSSYNIADDDLHKKTAVMPATKLNQKVSGSEKSLNQNNREGAQKSSNEASSEARWSLNQKNADIRDFIAQIAAITKQTFIIDPKVQGGHNVTVISSMPLTKDQVYDVFLEVLTANNYAAITKGRVINIVPSVIAKSTGQQDRSSHKAIMTTRVIELHSVPSIEVVPIIRPLVAEYGHIAASMSGSAVIVSDLADNVDRIAKIIQELDNASNNDYDVILLKHAWVGDIAKIIQETLVVGRGQMPSGVQVIADDRSNRLIVKGNVNKRVRIRTLVETLDLEGAKRATTKVMFLSYGDAKNMAAILSEASSSLQDNKGKEGENASRTMYGGNNNSQQKVGQANLPPGVFVKADETQNALVMIADHDTLQSMERIVRQLDRPRAQVLLEAAIVEVVGDINDALGVQWGIDGRKTIRDVKGDADSRGLSSITGAIFGNSSITLGSIALRDDNFGMLVTALSKKTNSNILSTPSLLTLDNQEAEFLVGENVPIKTGSYQTASQGDTKNPFTTTERKDIGIKLKLTPHLGEGESLKLELHQEVSSRRNNLDIAAASGDIIYDNRTLKTTVLVDDGQTIVIGGLIRDDHETAKHKVPLLGDIPLLGKLFRYNSYTSTKRNLMLFIRPTIMRNSDTLVKATQDRFTKLKLVHKDGKATASEYFPENPDGLFDSKAFDLRSKDKPSWAKDD